MSNENQLEGTFDGPDATLRRDHDRLAEAQALVRMGSWELILATNELWWSEETYRLFEIDPTGFAASYEAFLSLVHPDDREFVNLAYTTAVAKHTQYDIVHRLLMPDGRIKHAREVGRTIYDEKGAPLRSVGAVHDITDWVEFEAKAQATERRFRAMIEHSSDIVGLVSPEGEILYLNKRFQIVLGAQIEDWVGRNFRDLMWPGDGDMALRLFQETMSNANKVMPWRIRVKHGDGGFRWLDGTSSNQTGDSAIGAVVINCRDITEQLQAEEALRQSEERLRQAIRVTRVGIFDHDLRTNTVYSSPRQREIHGFDTTAYVSVEDFVRALHPDDAAWVHESVSKAHDPSGDGRWEVTYRIVRTDGAIRWLNARAQAFFEGEGDTRRVVRTVGAVVDVTELRQADEAMRIKDQAIETSLTPIAITSVGGQFVYVNPAFVHTWGYDSREEILRLLPTDLAEPGPAADLMNQLRASGTFQGELTARRKDGTPFDIMVSANVVRDEIGRTTHLMASIMDVSDARRLQAQLMQVQKMESVGRLAGGLAHDFNNLLTVIKGYVELAIGRLDSRDPLHRDLLQVNVAADSAASLTHQLLAFSRKQVIKPEVLDLSEVITHVERMLVRLLGEDIRLHVILDDTVGNVRFDRAQFEQILVNLAVNARDAMPHGGALTIETAKVRFEQDYAHGHPGVQPGEFVMLAVTDTGHGMAEDVRAKIFEPFFTTKGPGKGTGLGLPMVFGSVSQNGGRIEVYSEVGHGTTFKIYLPVASDPVADRVVPPATALGRGRETIFLVEDDSAVRGFAKTVLVRHGYDVHEFADGQEALDGVAALDRAVQLLVTDVVMPGMNGRVLAENLRALCPGIGVLYTSGYTENVIVLQGTLKPGLEFLQKPYSVESLLRRVREVLDALEIV